MNEAAIKPKTKNLKQKNHEFNCEFCSATFARERTLLAHFCEKKRRLFDKDTKSVRMGFHVYQKFWLYSYPYSKKKTKTYEDFVNFSEYSTFTSFGKHLIDIRAINPDRFIEFLLKNSVKIVDWKKDEVYLTYIRELSKSESPDAAVERNILLMQQWANDNECAWVDFFRNVQPSAAVHYIKSGRISPWVMYTTQSGQDMLARLSDEQIEMVRKYIDPDFWQLKFKHNIKDFEDYRDMLTEAGL